MLKPQTKLEKYDIKVSKYEELFEVINNLDEYSRIAIVDDIDCDGVMSAYITKYSLNKKFNNIDVIINDRHGLVEKKELVMDYDLVIIVDSSSDLVDTYGDLEKVIIIDHHLYDKSKVSPDNVLLLNSKDTEGLECVSAGMFCYLLWEQWAKDSGVEFDTTMFSLGITSIYGDIVPVDELITNLIEDFIEDIKNNKIHTLLNSLNTFKKAMSRSVISYNIVPLINYTRKMQDTRTISMIYRNCMSIAGPAMLKNSRLIRKNVDYIYKKAIMHDSNSFMFMDISDINSEIKQDMRNFKGLICNRIQKECNKPGLVAVRIDEDLFDISVRSEGYDSYEFIKNNELQGGGHAFACGFRCSKVELKEILVKYEEYLSRLEFNNLYEVLELNLNNIHENDFNKVSFENEFKFSNLPTTQYSIRLNTNEIDNVDILNKKINIGGLSLTCFDTESLQILIDNHSELTAIITPTVDSHVLGTHILVTEFENVI